MDLVFFRCVVTFYIWLQETCCGWNVDFDYFDYSEILRTFRVIVEICFF